MTDSQKYSTLRTKISELLHISYEPSSDLGRPEFFPIFLDALELVVTELIDLGETKTLKERIAHVWGLRDYESDLAASGSCEEPKSLIKTDGRNYSHIRHVLSGFFSDLCLKLGYQHGGLFREKPDLDCCKCGRPGETWGDYRSWNSGVFPEDESYDRVVYEKNYTPWGLDTRVPDCKCYRGK